MTSLPTPGEEFAKLTEHLRKAQESAAMIGHLRQAEGKNTIGTGWLAISEALKLMIHQVIQLAKSGLQ